MSTYTQIFYHIVFSTKNRCKSLSANNRVELYKYISGILKNKGCHVYRVNGVEDHIHMVISLHPSISLSSLIKDVKLSCTDYIKRDSLFQNFAGWQNGYGAFTFSVKDKDRLVEYVKNQEKHHQKKDYQEELIELLREHNIDFNEKYIL